MFTFYTVDLIILNVQLEFQNFYICWLVRPFHLSVDHMLSTNNSRVHSPVLIKLCAYVPGGQQMTPTHFGIRRSKVKVTVTLNPKILSALTPGECIDLWSSKLSERVTDWLPDDPYSFWDPQVKVQGHSDIELKTTSDQ